MPEVTATTDLMSPLNLFLQADVVVKLVMVGLLLASVWTWAIIFTHAIRLKRVNRQTDAFETRFLGGQRHRRLPRPAQRREAADRRGHVGGHGRMAPLDPRPRPSTAPAPASGSPAG